MRKYERSLGGPALQFTDFLRRIHAYHHDNTTDNQLAMQLRACEPDSGRTPEAYSILKEIIRRQTGLSLYDTQLVAAWSMGQGRIAELPTGEGKTLAAVVTAAMFALQQRKVHILVFNDYLATRDSGANRPIYEVCGLTCGCVVEASDWRQRQAAYACDVVYVSAKEAGFDCLRDFLCTDRNKLLLPGFQVALVDEADSILIDEARIPLVLAGNAQPKPSVSMRISEAVAALIEDDIGLDRKENKAWLTDAGVRAMEDRLGIENLFMPEQADTLAMIHAAVEARCLLRRDKDYIVKDGAVLVVDELTGRVAENRRFPDLLQQAVEAQELRAPAAFSAIYNTMTIQAFLRQYQLLCGMTGTAATSAYEFRQMYDLAIDVIPPHTPCIRTDHADLVFAEKAAQERAVLACVQAAHAKGQPVLMGTRSVEESEHYAARLSALRIPHAVLNARNDAEEAAIIAQAGRPCQVTISTNMAGRGVDIRLGGQGAEEEARARAAGGLCVISTGINRSLRVDNQLRGRAGRQGDPGESRFFVCLEDLTLDEAYGIEPHDIRRYPKLLRRAQRAQEREDIEARYMLERYSSILEGQRKRITEYRTQLLLDRVILNMTQREDPQLYEQLLPQAGKRGIAIAEKQLMLYFINMNWALYLEAMDNMRSGIHLMVIGRKSPLDEYMLFAAAAFDEMLADIRRDVMAHMKKCHITENGIDMAKAGLMGATTTWTYMINENTLQFTRIPQIIKAMTNTAKGTLFSVRGIYAKVKDKLRGAR